MSLVEPRKNLFQKMNEVHEEGTEIAIINFDQLINEAEVSRVNYGGTIGECKIEVYAKERLDVPHFHVYSIKTDKKHNPILDACVKIYEAALFAHGHHDDILTNDQCRALDAVLRLKNKKSKYNDSNSPTNWEVISGIWCQAHPESLKQYDTENMPDYTTIE